MPTVPTQAAINLVSLNMPLRYGEVLSPGYQNQLYSDGTQGSVLSSARAGNLFVGVIAHYDGTSYDRFIGTEGTPDTPTHIVSAIMDTVSNPLPQHYIPTSDAGIVQVTPLEINGRQIVVAEDSVGGAITSPIGKYVDLINGTDIISNTGSGGSAGLGNDQVPSPWYNIYIDSSSANASAGSLHFRIDAYMGGFVDSSGVTHNAYLLTRVA